MTTRDDFIHTVDTAGAGLLSDGAVATITRAADSYRASGLAEFAESLDRLAYETEEAGRGRGFLRALRASIAAESHRLAARKARAAAGQPEAATTDTLADRVAADWAATRADGHRPAHARRR